MGKPYLPFSRITGDWSDRPLYIIGGGPSIKDFPFSKLQGRKLGANKSAWVADCDAMCTIDQHFTRMCRADIVRFVEGGGEAVLAMPSTEDGHIPIPGATYVYRHRNDGLSDDPSKLFGVHSGYAALNLAYLKGAREIALLGFDMDYAPDGRSHFHEGYAWQNPNSPRYYDTWSRNFDRAARQLTSAGITVINFVGPNGSKVMEFPKRPLTDLY